MSKTSAVAFGLRTPEKSQLPPLPLLTSSAGLAFCAGALAADPLDTSGDCTTGAVLVREALGATTFTVARVSALRHKNELKVSKSYTKKCLYKKSDPGIDAAMDPI